MATPPKERSASGLATQVLKVGTGKIHPRPQDWVKLHFKLWTSEGKLLDDTWAKKDPLDLSLDRVMKGMSEGIQRMVIGEKRRLWIPESLAFAGAPGRPSGPMLMDVELFWIDAPPHEAPADVAGPPPEAVQHSSGLYYRVLRPGAGTERASRRSRVLVHYTGWTTDGKMFDSSVLRRSPQSFRLGDVIQGWILGIPLMAKGEKSRFWIPEKLAYQGERGKPAGMLVFDIELLAIDP